jgi:hypothetical protein
MFKLKSQSHAKPPQASPVTSCGDSLPSSLIRAQLPINSHLVPDDPAVFSPPYLSHITNINYAKMADSSDNPTGRFASSAHTAEDLLKSQTVGLVHLSDFRKRRAEALEASEGGSGASTPTGSESRYVAFLFCATCSGDVWTETDRPSTVSRLPKQAQVTSRTGKRA